MKKNTIAQQVKRSNRLKQQEKKERKKKKTVLQKKDSDAVEVEIKERKKNRKENRVVNYNSSLYVHWAHELLDTVRTNRRINFNMK